MANTIQNLMVMLGLQSDGLVNGLGQVEQRVSGFAGKVNGLLASITFAGMSVGAVAASEKFEAAFAQIQRSTGATEEKMKELEGSFSAVYTKTAASAEAVSSTLALLSTRTKATGKDLEDLTLKTLKLAKTQSEDVAVIVPAVTQMFAAWGIATNQQSKAMDYLRVVSQQTGAPVSKLTEEVVAQMPQLKALGYNWQQSAALVGSFEKSGAIAQGALVALKKVLAGFAKEGVKDTAAEWQKLVKGVEDGTVSFDQFLKIAGAKGGTALFQAIRDHRADIQQLTAEYQNLADKGGTGIETMKVKVTKWTHEVETLIAAHRDLVIGIGLALPAVQSLGGAFTASFGAALPAIANVVTALRFGLMGALTAVEGMLVAGGIVAAIAAIGAAGYKLGDVIQQKFAPGGNTTAYNPNQRYQLSGHQVIDAGPKPAIGGLLMDFIGGLPSGAKPGGAGSVKQLDDKEIKQAFSDLGLHDLQSELDAATKAFGELTAAHKLNDGQVIAATQHIVELRARIAELRAGYGADGPPTATADLLKTMGIGGPDAISRLQEFGTAFQEFERQRAAFVGPQSADGMRLGVDALMAYGRASLAAKAAEEARLIPFYDAIEAQNKENATLQESIDALNTLAGEHRTFAASLSPALGAVIGITDAYHSFNIKAPWELQASVDAQKRQYEILRDSGVVSARDLDLAFTQYKLDQIELDHELGVTDDELYAQQKKNAEDTIKILKGEHVSNDQRRKDTYDLGHELEQMSHRTFDSLERDLAKNIVEWKGWTDTIKNLGKTLAEDFLSIMLKGLFKPLEDAFAKIAGKIGGWLAGIFGGGSSGATGAAGTAAGSAGGIGGAASLAGSAASAGTMATIGEVSSAASAVTGVIGVFQQADLYHAMKAVASNTLSTANDVANLRADEWMREDHLMRKLDDIWSSIRNIGGVGAGGDSVSALNTIRDYSKLLVAKFDEFVIPKMDVIIGQLNGGAVAAGAGGVYIDLRNSTLNGISQDTVDGLFNNAIRRARAAGAKF